MSQQSIFVAPESIAKDLHALPPHPSGLPWPTEQWPREEGSSETTAQADSLFNLEPEQGYTTPSSSSKRVN